MLRAMQRFDSWRLAAGLLAIYLVGGLAASPAQAQTTRPFADTLAERTQACSACHGAQGRAAPDGYYPRIAGKPAAYLYHQLLNFKEGRRHYGLMTRLVDPLTDAYLLEIAQHFAALDLPYPPPPAAAAPTAVLQRGQQLALQGDASRQLPACVQCHGNALTGVLPQVPGLLGLPRDYVQAQLGAWRTLQRRAHAPDCMGQIAKRMAEADIHAVASWLAAQPLPANTQAAATLPALAAGAAPRLDCGSAPAPATATARQP